MSSSTCVTTDSGTLKVTVMPPLPLRSSSSKTASLTCTLPPFDAIRPFRLIRVSLLAGTDETSTASQASVSRSFGPTRLKSPATVGRVGIARQGRLGLQHQVARQGGGKLRHGDGAARASSSSAMLRTGCLL